MFACFFKIPCQFFFFAIVMAKTIHELLKYGIEVNTLSPPLMEFLRYFGTFPDIDDCLCFHCCTVGGAITHFIKEY